jgi:hypothetical protein
MGNLASANAVKYPGQAKFASTPLKAYTVRGKKAGEFKTVNNLSFLNVNNAGHEAAFYVSLNFSFLCMLCLPLYKIADALSIATRGFVTSFRADYAEEGYLLYIKTSVRSNEILMQLGTPYF